ncbi:MAG: endonuclease/exonuclease/phosphatase family protein [Thermoguttaceae bacterium]|nr:endonuclease/exonuclease/phosphatase family protein [Thermoguttaceae bacterium]
MKKSILFSVIFALLVTMGLSLTSAFAQDTAANDSELRILSFNIRLSYGEVGKPHEWKHRKAQVVDIMRKGGYDLIGVQEAIMTSRPNLNQVEDLKKDLPEYGMLVRSRTKSPTEGESTPIMWRKDRWEIDAKEQGVFWLSDTPDVPESITWGNACPRTVIWGKFHELKDGKRTGRAVYFINTHFDHVSEKARQLASVMIADFAAKRADQSAPVFLTGDFNTGENSASISYLTGKKTNIQGEEKVSPLPMVDTFRVANPDEFPACTYNFFGKASPNGAKIDYIMMYGDLKVKSAKINREKKDIYPSDHYPIDAVMEW